MHIPSVTWDDITDFHSRHFLGVALPEPTEQTWEDEEEEDELGYYSDGTKRTLTDEQIAIFRHSELQALIKKHRYDAEEGDETPEREPNAAQHSTANELPETDEGQEQPMELSSNDDLIVPARMNVDVPPAPLSPQEPPVAQKKKKRNRTKKSKKRVYRPEKMDAEKYKDAGEARTYRRICREADSTRSHDVELDY